MSLVDEALRFIERAERGIDVAVVGDVVAVVDLRRRVPRVDPNRVDTELGQVRKPRPHSLHVTETIAVGIGK